MIPHELKLGQTIYDTHSQRWGEVSKLPDNKEAVFFYCDEGDVVIGYSYDGNCYCETQSGDAYPLAVGRYFWGEDVCDEINADKFDSDHDYDFYCPERDENCWAFECTEND